MSEPNEDLIPRNIENSGIQEILDEYSSALK